MPEFVMPDVRNMDEVYASEAIRAALIAASINPASLTIFEVKPAVITGLASGTVTAHNVADDFAFSFSGGAFQTPEIDESFSDGFIGAVITWTGIATLLRVTVEGELVTALTLGHGIGGDHIVHPYGSWIPPIIGSHVIEFELLHDGVVIGTGSLTVNVTSISSDGAYDDRDMSGTGYTRPNPQYADTIGPAGSISAQWPTPDDTSPDFSFDVWGVNSSRASLSITVDLWGTTPEYRLYHAPVVYGRIQWDEIGLRKFETGVDRGVLYLADGRGIPWNGLTGVDEVFDENSSPYYIDGIKYLDAESLSDFHATLKAFTYPEEFEPFVGLGHFDNGLLLDGQPVKTFGLSYRTLIGNDVDGQDHGHKIHILWNVTAIPSSLTYSTLSESVTPMEFSWELSSVPQNSGVVGVRPTAHVILDSTELEPSLLALIEDKLYGTESTAPSLPSLSDLTAFALAAGP